jgi:hydroxyacylglutathione hydrolase
MNSWFYAAPAHPLVQPIPAFSDNYLWLIKASHSRQAAVVDPGDAAPVLAELRAGSLKLVSILLTHHHADHAGGVAELVQVTGARVVGPRAEAIAGVTEAMDGGESVDPGLGGAPARVLSVPGHTRGHIAYFFEQIGDDPRPVLFCGDTLFAAGCGRVFEGTPAAMLSSLDLLAGLPEDTLVYCAHEYTMSNLRFASAVEPCSAEIVARSAEAATMREAGLATVPSTIGVERRTNPFLRVDHEAVQAAAANRLSRLPVNRTETFAAIRDWKNSFR